MHLLRKPVITQATVLGVVQDWLSVKEAVYYSTRPCSCAADSKLALDVAIMARSQESDSTQRRIAGRTLILAW